MVRAWIYDEQDTADQREPHKGVPVQWVSLDHLSSLGVSYWCIPTTPAEAAAHPDAGELGVVRKQRGYKNYDIIRVSPTTLPDYHNKIKRFFCEHLHEDEEIRYVLAGSGYFDVRRDSDQAWIRIEVTSGDMIVLPAGCYHRYTNDVSDDAQVMRLFKDNPKWEAIDRGERAEQTRARAQYKQSLVDVANNNHINGTTTTTTTTNPTSTVDQAGGLQSESGINGESFLLTHKAAALANYPHMRAYGGLLYVSGISSRRIDNTHAGVTHNADGSVTLDIQEQTRAVLENIRSILGIAHADLSHVIDLTTFLVDMKDYKGYNTVYNEYFPDATLAPSRTTVAVKQLPHPNLLIEIKCVAVDPRQKGVNP